MKTIALYSMKGGVGKTTTCVNLAYLAAAGGEATLVCELDPQGSASFFFRIRPNKKFSAKKLLKGGREITRNIKGTDYDNLDLLPARLSFRSLDLELSTRKKSGSRLKSVFHELADEYEYIFIDCPPNINLLSENVFNAADFLLVPVIPTTLASLTYEKLLRFFKKKNYDSKKIYIFFSMAEQRKLLHQETMAALAAKGRQMLSTVIPYRAEIEKMGIYREPLPAFNPDSDSARTYRELWQEFQQRIGDG